MWVARDMVLPEIPSGTLHLVAGQDFYGCTCPQCLSWRKVNLQLEKFLEFQWEMYQDVEAFLRLDELEAVYGIVGFAQ